MEETKEELISVSNFNLLVKIILEGVNYGLNPYLPEFFAVKMRVLSPRHLEKEVSVNEETRLRRLHSSARALETIFQFKRILAHAGLEFVLLELLFCHFYLGSKGIEMLENDKTLSEIFQNRSLLFQHLMLLKGLPGVTREMNIALHKSLLAQVKSEGGFEICTRLLMSKSNVQGSDWKTYEIISKIVAAKGHTKDFYQEILNQIVIFLRSCLGVKDLEKFIPVCTTCLQKLSENSPEMFQLVKEKVLSWLDTLIKPPETLKGTIVMTGSQFYESLLMITVCFGGSTVVSLPSKMLVTYYKVLFR